MHDVAAAQGAQRWYRGLERKQWNTLIAATLSWMFDGYETYALILTVGVALRQLLDPAPYSQTLPDAGRAIGLSVRGWGIGGMIGGILADYIGRKRTMIIAI